MPDLVSASEEPMIKRSFELKLEILQKCLGWNLLILDEKEYAEMVHEGGPGAFDRRKKYIFDRLRFDDGEGNQEEF